MRKLAFLFLCSYAVSGGVAHAATYYVSQSGSNDNPCEQARFDTSAKQTVAAGIACLAAGDTLLVRAGSYPEEIKGLPSGTSWDNKVRIAAYPGESVWIAPSGTDYLVGLKGSEQYIEFDGINMDGGGTNYGPVMLGGTSHHIRLQNAEIIGSRTAGNCANICGGSDSEMINLAIHGGGIGGGCGTPCATYGIYTGGSNNLVDGCDIYDVSMQGIQIYNGSASNNIIRNNRIHDITRSGDNDPGARYVGIIIASGSNNVVYNNLLYNIGRADGASGNAAITVYGGSTGTKIWYNTIQADFRAGISIETAVANSVVQNNIVSGSANIVDNGSGTTRDHNLEGTNPMFVDAGGGNFRLQAGSPAVNAGTGVEMVTKDMAGAARSQGDAPDIGAYEFGGSNSAAAPATPSGFKIVLD